MSRCISTCFVDEGLPYARCGLKLNHKGTHDAGGGVTWEKDEPHRTPDSECENCGYLKEDHWQNTMCLDYICTKFGDPHRPFKMNPVDGMHMSHYSNNRTYCSGCDFYMYGYVWPGEFVFEHDDSNHSCTNWVPMPGGECPCSYDDIGYFLGDKS